MKRFALAFAVAAAFAGGASAAVAYELRVTASYQFGTVGDLLAGPGGAPDTSFANFFNAGTSTFTGTLSLSGFSPVLGALNVEYAGTFGAGNIGSLSLTNESSNYGGFNRNANTGVDDGILVRFVGTVTDGVNTENVDLQVYDKDIHSGVFATNPYGVTLDNYILQGGDPLGRDTEDAFEVGQAPGVYIFQQAPAPGAMALMGMGGLALARRRR